MIDLLGGVLNEDFVWGYCAVIVAFALCCAIKLAYEARSLRIMLQKLINEIRGLDGQEGFVSGFERYNKRVEAVFGLPWTEFVETLVLPEPDSGDPVRNTGEVSRYLNDTTIIFPRIPFGFYQSVPNLLTGFGILGTFLGLAAGVGSASSGLASDDQEAITASLQQLLGGASLAFLTSIFGIGCSILFVPVDRWYSRQLHLAVDNWVASIESRLERVTPEGVALKQLEEAKRAVTQLERFNTDLVFSLEKALEEKIVGRLSAQLEQLLEAVGGLRADRSTDAGRMIDQALDRFTKAMQERAGSHFEEMASIVAELNRTLKHSADGLTQSQQDVRKTLNSILSAIEKSMHAGADAMTDTLQQSLEKFTRVISDASGQLAERLTTSSTAAAKELQGAVSSATQKLVSTGVEAATQISESLRGLEVAADSLNRSTRQSEQILTNMTAFVDQMNTLRGTIKAAQQQIVNVLEPVGRAARDISESSDRTAGALKHTSELVGRVEVSVNTLGEHQQRVANAWTDYQKRFEGIDDSLARVFQQIDEGLSGYCEKVKDFANELDNTTSNVVQQLAGATAELNQSVDDLTDHLRRSR